EFGVTPAVAATARQTFERFAIGWDGRLRIDIAALGELTLRAEVVRARNLDRSAERADPAVAGRDLHELGWLIGASQELTPFAMVAAQYDVYEPDMLASETPLPRLGTRLATLALAASLRLRPWRWMVQFEREQRVEPRNAT